MTGLIDWGDACHSWLVAEPAIAVCYMMQLTADRQPFTSAAALLVSNPPPLPLLPEPVHAHSQTGPPRAQRWFLWRGRPYGSTGAAF